MAEQERDELPGKEQKQQQEKEDEQEMEEMEAESGSEAGSAGPAPGPGTDSDSESETDESEKEAEVQRLEEQLSINAHDYNCHTDLIKLLQQLGELERLAKARQKMSELFPLTEELWLDWLKDEIRMGTDEAERDRVSSLFERAVKDYLCPEIWLEYAQYSIGGMGQAGGVERVRAVFERALTAVGLHVTKGSAVWDAYREFENAVLGMMQPVLGVVLSAVQQEQLKAQTERLNTLFRRQLSLPLMDMEACFTEYEEWLESPVEASVRQAHGKALKQLEKYKSFENALLVAEPPKMAEYQAYIECELKEGDPARVQLVFERALADNCLVPDLWAQYTKYLDMQLKIKEVVLPAHRRATRNCPWATSLWKSYLLALERHHAEHDTVREVFDKALESGFMQATDYTELWQTYIDYLRRRVDFTQGSSQELEELRMTFHRAVESIRQEVAQRCAEGGDSSSAILQHWARIEANHCHNVQKARELWDQVMSQGNAKYGNMWLEYYHLERAFGDVQHARRALHRAVQCTSDYPEHICEALLTFEREEGTLEDWDAACQKIETKLKRVSEQRAKAAEKEAQRQRQEEERAKAKLESKGGKKSQKKEQHISSGKRKAEPEWGHEAAQASKRIREEAGGGVPWEEDDDEDEESKGRDTGAMVHASLGLFGCAPPSAAGRASGPGSSARPGPSRAAPGFPKGKAEKKGKAAEQAPTTTKFTPGAESCTVFVSNMAYSLADPNARLREALAPCGTIAEVRPVYSHSHHFRGYCYVQFDTEEGARGALAMDRTSIDGRPMFISPCVDKTKQQEQQPNKARESNAAFKYSTDLEKHKLFVSGLPFSCTKDELEEMFGKHGSIRETRMVTTRAGKFKGLAYIEYETVSQAAQAVLNLNGTTVRDSVVSVAISNPPARRRTDQQQQQQPAMPPRSVYGARGKGRTQLALVPRALQRRNAGGSKSQNGTAAGGGAGSGRARRGLRRGGRQRRHARRRAHDEQRRLCADAAEEV
ncbi:unnamed protein product, partial [Lampetra fluviatilis]